jgi:hypothetical protein
MRRLLVAALVALTGCGGAGVTVIPRSDLPEDVYGSPDPPSGSALPDRATVYLTEGGRVVAAPRRLPEEAPSLPHAMLETLFEEPGGVFGTAIPPGARVLSVRVRERVATVDLSEEFEGGAPGGALALRVAQVVFTLTEAPGIFAVVFEIEGEGAGVLTGSERVVQRPVSRADYQRFAPPEADDPDA